jgi:CheY-like chemotaxis protein
MDIMMPIMDGYAAMRAMRALPASGDVPIIAVTAAVEAGERQRCIDAGATAYVTKPVDTASLLVVLDEWLPADLPAGGPIAALG